MLVTHIVKFILCEYKLEPIAMQVEQYLHLI